VKRSLARAGTVAVASAVVCAPLTGLAHASTPAAVAGHHSHKIGIDAAAKARALAAKTKIDATLLSKSTGAVDVMLELSNVPAVTSFRKGLSTSHAAAVADSRSAVSRVLAQQASVASHFGAAATRAQKLFAVHSVYNGVAVRTDRSRLAALAAMPGVKHIHVLTTKHTQLASSVPLIKAPQAWETNAGTGTGVRIGLIDTGIDYTHADFGGDGTTGAYDAAKAADTLPPSTTGGLGLGGFDGSKVVGGYDFAGDSYNPDSDTPADQIPHPDPNPLDCNSHGTHTAGIAAGLGVDAGGATYTGTYSTATDFSAFKVGPGVAPGAKLYALKVFGCDGSTNLVSQALDWVADPNGDGDLSDHLDVLNMSLGSSFAPPDDPDSVATNNLAALGVIVATSAGNDNDLYDVGGSPGNATRTIDTAASDDGQDYVDGMDITAPVAIAGTVPAQQAQLYDWTSGDVSGAIVKAPGDWTQPPSPTNNIDGCNGRAPLHPGDDNNGPELASVPSGSIYLLYWDDVDGTRRCTSGGHATSAGNAGAIGAVFGSNHDYFLPATAINGNATTPAELVRKSTTDAIIAQLDDSNEVDVTLTGSHAGKVPVSEPMLTDTVAFFSSRGIGAAGNLKPDVAAPGATILSAGMGTGSDGLNDSGTSMAAPHVAGVAALVHAAHPHWTVEQVKAAIMNTATEDVYSEIGQTGAVYSPMRVGAGRVNAQQAVGTQTLAYNGDDSGAVSVSFGPVAAATTTTLSKTIHIVNTRPTSAAHYSLSYDATDDNPGATYSLSTSNVTVPALGSVDVTVTLTVDPSLLTDHPDPTRSSEDPDFGTQLPFLNEAAGRVVLTPTSGTSGSELRVPVYSAPRPVSTMSQAAKVTVGGSGTTKTGAVTLTGDGVDHDGWFSTIDGFELQATSPKLPDCTSTATTDCVEWATQRAADIQDVGVASDAPSIIADGGTTADALDAGLLHFGVSSWGPFRTAASDVEHDVFIDVDGDGTPDLVTYNSRWNENGPDTDTDVLFAFTVDLATDDLVDLELTNNIDGTLDVGQFNSDVMTLPVGLFAIQQKWADLGGSGTVSRIHYWVDSLPSESTFAGPLDSVGDPDAGQTPLSVNVVSPAVSVTDPSTGPVLLDDQPGNTIPVSYDMTQVAQDKPLGLLLFHRLNADGSRAQVVGVRQATSTLLTSAKNPSPYGFRVPVTATITPSAATGSVTFKDGAKVLGTVPVSSGKATLTLPVLSVGKHSLRAFYSGDGTYAASTSAVRTQTVTRAASKTTLTSSATKVSAGTSVTLKAVTTVVAPGKSPVTGTVTFYDGTKSLGTFSTTGTRSLTTPHLTKGTHVFKAVYSGNPTLAGSSGTVTVVAS